MPYKAEKMTIKDKKFDRRVKLTDEQKIEIKENKHDLSQRALARMYDVSRRTITFILDPEKLVENKKRRAERGGSKQYYDKEKHRVSMKEHRQYKQVLYKAGLLKSKEMANSKIKIVNNEDTDFVWLIVTEKAKEVFNGELFDLYALYDDESESLIESMAVLEKALENGLEIGIEVGNIEKRKLTPEKLDNTVLELTLMTLLSQSKHRGDDLYIEVINNALQGKNYNVGTVASIITQNMFDAIRQKLNNGTIAAHEKIQQLAIDFEIVHAHIKDDEWEEYCIENGHDDWEVCIIDWVKENYLEESRPKTFLIDGYYKDDGAPFDSYKVAEFDDSPEDDEDDDIFFYGLSEENIKEAIELKENTVHDFVITNYRIL